MKKWIVKQQDIKDCGVCTILSLIKYYDGYVPIETLRMDTYTNQEGTSAYHIIKTLKKYNFEATGIKIEQESFQQIHLPAIAHVIINNRLPHFVVVYKITKSKVMIMDPGRGIVTMSIEEWFKIFDGIIIICHPMNKLVVIDHEHKISELFKKIIITEKRLIIKIIFVSVILMISSIISSFFLKFAINSISQEGIYFEIDSVIFAFGLILFIKLFTTYIRSYYEVYLNKNIDLKLLIPFLSHLFKIPLGNIKSRSVGEISTRVYELNDLKELFSKIFLTIFLDLILALTTFLILVNINLNLSIIVCVMLLIYSILGFCYSSKIKRKAVDNIESQTIYHQSLVESINSISSIKNIHESAYFNNQLISKLLIYLKNTFSFKKFILLEQTTKQVIFDTGLFMIMVYGVILISQGKLSVINLITFSGIVSYLTGPFKSVIDALPQIEFIKASYFKLNDFLSMKEEILDESTEPFISGDIKINNLSFSYNGYKNIVNKLNLLIKEKEKVVITGPSGQGKSTICKLILRLMEFNEGEILINNINIKDYMIDTIRKNVCYIDQNEVLLSDTIYNNIVLNKHISIQEFNDLMQICQIDKIIKDKPLRYNTYLLEQGSNLSGGEKQRIILARGLLKNGQIVILDEALSEVSEEMEKEIIGNIIKRYYDKTIIYISHHHQQHKSMRIINLKDCYEQ